MIAIEKKIDELNIERWGFAFIDKTIYLNSYSLLQKESKMHRKFKVLKSYERLSGRGSTMKENEVPFSDELKAEALNKFVSTIKVKLWSEK